MSETRTAGQRHPQREQVAQPLRHPPGLGLQACGAVLRRGLRRVRRLRARVHAGSIARRRAACTGGKLYGETWRQVTGAPGAQSQSSRGGSNVVLRPACALTQSVQQLQPQLRALMRILKFRGHSMSCLRL